jgi:hypothetical protein
LDELDTISIEYGFLADALNPTAADGGNMMLCRPIGELRGYFEFYLDDERQNDYRMQ